VTVSNYDKNVRQYNEYLIYCHSVSRLGAINSSKACSIILSLLYIKNDVFDVQAFAVILKERKRTDQSNMLLNSLRPELNPICYLLALLAHHFLHVSRIRVKSLTLRLLMSYMYIYIYIERERESTYS
jgi:hypothetical protein